MKITWGHKLFFFAALFMVFILSMVFYLFNQHVELEETNYYEKGIKYQEVIDEMKNAENMLNVSIPGNGINFQPIQAFKHDTISVEFKRPSDKSKDFVTRFELNDTLPFIMSTDKIDKGIWKLEVSWHDAAGKHLIKKEFNLKR